MALGASPFSTAFLAIRPAPIMTVGFEVFVQLVIAAMIDGAVVQPAGVVPEPVALDQRLDLRAWSSRK